MALPLERRKFSVVDYHRMLDAGILDDDDRVELIEGEIVQMAPIHMPHAMCVTKLASLLVEQIRRQALVWSQNPIMLSEGTELQPDVALLRLREYASDELAPGPDDVLLIVEVSDSTVSKDRRVKGPLYAQATIPEYWLVNLPKKVVEVYSEPSKGSYQQVRHLRRGETLQVPGFPDALVVVDEILG